MKIRKVKTKDLKRISELLRVEYKKPPYNEKWTNLNALRKVKIHSEDNIIFVLEIQNKIEGLIIGKIYLTDKSKNGYCNEMIVSTKFQGKGYGKMLLNKFIMYLRKNNVKNLELMSNTKSKAFKVYNKLGFKQSKDFVYMEKKLK